MFAGATTRVSCAGHRALATAMALAFLWSAMPVAQAQTDAAPVVQPGAPGSPSRTLPASARPTAPQASQADIEFMQGMIMHHAQAVEMTAMIPSSTQNAELHSLGARIGLSQTDEIKFMQRWLLARGEPLTMSMPAMGMAAMPAMPGMDMGGSEMPPMPGMLSAEQMRALRRARGAEFDQLFLTGMIQHHNGALVMVKQLFDTAGAGQDADLFDFATDADNTQRAEIEIMQHMLKEKR